MSRKNNHFCTKNSPSPCGNGEQNLYYFSVYLTERTSMERLGFVCIMMSAFVTFQWAARASSPCSSRSGSRGSWCGTRSRPPWAASWPHSSCTSRTGAPRSPATAGRAVGTGLVHHLLQQFGVFQHRAGTQMVLVEGLAVVISHEQRAVQNSRMLWSWMFALE